MGLKLLFVMELFVLYSVGNGGKITKDKIMFKYTPQTFIATIVCFMLMSTASYAHEEDTKGMGDMKKCMTMSKTGNVDEDFIRNMIPHHQMAIDMAQKELDKGKDNEARDMAQKIIDAQNEEIKTMQTWLDNHKEK